MADVVSPVIGSTPNPSVMVALPSGTPQLCPNESATPCGSKRARPGALTPSEGATVQLARTNAAAVLSDFAHAAVSSELLAHAKTLNEVLLAIRALESRFDSFDSFRTEITSAVTTTDLR